MINYEGKLVFLARRKNWMCPIAASMGRPAQAQELHHKCHNTRINRKKYPLFIDSLLNLLAVNHSYHMIKPSWAKITDYQAGKYEAFLRRHPKIAMFVNGEGL
jgi:hypothetical protein